MNSEPLSLSRPSSGMAGAGGCGPRAADAILVLAQVASSSIQAVAMSTAHRVQRKKPSVLLPQ